MIVTCRASDCEYTHQIIYHAIKIAQTLDDADHSVFLEDKDGYRVRVFPTTAVDEVTEALLSVRTKPLPPHGCDGC